MKMVYIAGPYRAPTTWQITQNIQRAQEVGAQVLQVKGLYPVIPHMNTHHMDGIADDQHVLDGTMEMLRRCDAVILVGGWESSSGTIGEIREAQRLGLPILYAWGDASYNHERLCMLARTPMGYRTVPRPGVSEDNCFRVWGTCTYSALPATKES